MLVYTSQSKDVWQQLSLTGRYLANPKNLNAMNNLDKNWQKAYRWMENKMSEKLNKPKKAITPIWWWPVTKTLDNIQPYDKIYDYNHNLLYKNHCPTNINPTNEVILWNKKQSQLQLANLKNTKQLMTI